MTERVGLRTYQFTLLDAAWMAGVTEKAVRLWMQRGHLAIGHKHFLGRWEFNMLDVIELCTLAHLASTNLMLLEQAGTVAAFVAKLAEDPVPEDGRRMLLVAFRNGHPALFLNTEANVNGAYAELLRRPAVVIPVDSLIEDTHARVAELRAHNEQREGGSDD